MGDTSPKPYTTAFDEALNDAVTADVGVREENMRQLLKSGVARKAHPTFDHLLPIYVGAGAAEGEKGERLFTYLEGSLSWAQFRFGALPEVKL